MDVWRGQPIRSSPTPRVTHTGWVIDGRVVEPGTELVKTTSHETKSIWTRIIGFVPILPDRNDDPIEIAVEEESETWLGKNSKSPCSSPSLLQSSGNSPS